MTRASSSAPVMRRRGEITAEEGDEDFLDQYRTLNTNSASFRFCARSYFLTWSQIGDTPNSALKDLMASFGNQLKGMPAQHSL